MLQWVLPVKPACVLSADLVCSPWPVVYSSPSAGLVWALGLIFPWLTGKRSWWGAFKA